MTEEFRESFVEVHYHDSDFRLVTCVEVLSPSNKRKGSEGWDRYLRKRQALLLGEANLVELDLLRGGDRFPMLDPWPTAPYTLLVCRRQEAPTCRVKKIHSLAALPALPIPLAIPDPDVSVPLQPLVEAIYRRYHYDESIDYTKPCQPPLLLEESAWLAEQLRARSSGSAGIPGG